MNSVPEGKHAPKAWLLPVGTLFFLCGILLGRIPEAWFPLAALPALCLTAALVSRGWKRQLAWLMLIFSLGAMRGWLAWHPPLPEESAYTVEATVAQEVYVLDEERVQTVLADVTLNGTPWGDAYWTYYLEEGEAVPDWLVPGAQLTMTAEVYHPSGRMNPGGFSFQEYLLQRGMAFGLYGGEGLQPCESGFSLRGWMAQVRHDLALRLMDVMGEEAGSYAAAMLLGTRDFLPEDDRAAFNELGIAHILSVSGYHVAVLAALMMMMLHPLPIRRSLRLGIEGAVLVFYCMLTGGSAPVIRAALLLLWREFTQLRNRQLMPLHMLCVSALVQLLFNPTLLTGASFQLSYGAMLGLLLVYPWLKKQRTCRTRFRQRLWEAFCATLSAQLGVLMPQLYWFGELPLLSILANMIVMTLAGALLSLYWVTLAALPIPGLRMLLGVLCKGATQLLLSGVRSLAAQDFTTLWTRQADLLTFLGWALLMVGLSTLIPRRRQRYRKYCIRLGALLMALLLIPLPQLTTTYTQLSVGDADAAILQDRDVTVVIDTGDLDQTAATYLHQRRQRVELLILTHLHMDHAGGLLAMVNQGIPVDVCYLPVDAATPVIDEEVLPLLNQLAMTGTEFRYLQRGDVIDLPSGQLTVLWPVAEHPSPLHDANDVGLVLQAEIGGVTMLLTGDMSGTYEQYAALPSDILKVAHHGSKSATSENFLAQVDPSVLLLSNRLESREFRMAELAGDVPLYSTEACGAVTIRFHGDGEYTINTVLPR